MNNKKHQQLTKDQIKYYSARANEYDQWFLRQGRYDKGTIENELWFKEVEIMRHVLSDLGHMDRVLELACGTGLWTEQLAQISKKITAVDASPEMITINQTRMEGKEIEYIQADIFSWNSTEKFDLIFFGFWLSHVPPDMFNQFWERVSNNLSPDGQVYFIDSLYTQESTASDQDLRTPEDTVVSRVLNDGSEFEIVKVFYKPKKLEVDLTKLEWDFEVRKSGKYFLYGVGSKSST